MGNNCGCNENLDEIEIQTQTNLIKLKKVKLDSSFEKEKEIELKEGNRESMKQKLNNANQTGKSRENIEKCKTNDSSK